jgi:hypothetical protein
MALLSLLLFVLLAVPSAAQGYPTIYEHSAAFGSGVIPGDVTIKFSDGLNTEFECRLDGGSWTPCSSPKTYTGLADGPHNFGVRTLGDTAVTTFDWVTDKTGPVVTINSGPQRLTTSKSATFNLSWTDLHPDGGYLLCSLDTNPITAACPSPTTFTNLADGDRRLNVVAVDQVGNVSDTATYEWTIDTTPPDTTFTLKPNATTYDTTADFGFDSLPEAGPRDLYECSLDGASFTPCGRSQSYTGLAPGSHTLLARAIDRVGLVDPTPATWTWTVLPPEAAPDTAITEGPAGTVASTTALFRFSSATPSVYFECRIDGSAFAPCSEGYYTDLSEGSHTFAVRAVTLTGVPDPTPATRTWTVNLTPDTTPPETTITAGPSGTTSDPTPTFEFTSEPGASFECRLDGAAFSPCSSPETVAALADGAHTFEVRATDAAMNTDPTPATRSFSVDTESGPVSGEATISKAIVSGPARVKKGNATTYTVKITNSGTASANGVRLRVSGRGVGFNASVGTVSAASTKTVKVKLKPRSPGKIRTTFKVSSSNAGSKIVTKTITVKK